MSWSWGKLKNIFNFSTHTLWKSLKESYIILPYVIWTLKWYSMFKFGVMYVKFSIVFTLCWGTFEKGKFKVRGALNTFARPVIQYTVYIHVHLIVPANNLLIFIIPIYLSVSLIIYELRTICGQNKIYIKYSTKIFKNVTLDFLNSIPQRFVAATKITLC
jgi:hypothetical protein